MKQLTKKELVREEFKFKGFTYSDIGSKEIGILTRILEEELYNFDNKGFKMILRKIRKKDIEYKKDGTIKKCFLTVSGCVYGETPHFTRREAISFNPQDKTGNEFIGFAGWSDSTNLQPILNAFIRFMNELKQIT